MQVLFKSNQEFKALTPEVSAVFKALAYFDIFNYPLTIPEIEKYAGFSFSHLSDVENALNYLKDSFIVFQFGEYYTLKNEYCLITRRQAGNIAAFNIYKKAKSKADFIHKFPFVRSVNISGSLSKNYFDETTDIDFFVITEPNRLWLCRFLLTIYKKVFLFNSRKYFCINYYVDSNSLEIPDKNLFSATEIVTLRNQNGGYYYNRFLESNTWAFQYFPNYDIQFSNEPKDDISGLKKALEKLFAGRLGNFLEKKAHRITKQFISKKYKTIPEAQLNVNMRTEKSSSKHHPLGFQFKVLQQFENTCTAMEQKHSVTLH
jgi:hypothetical protein